MEFRQRHIASRRNQVGITLVELLIVISVIGFIAAFSLNGLLGARRAATVTAEAERFAAQIRETQSRSITAVKGRSWGIECDGQNWTLVSFDIAGRHLEDSQAFTSPIVCANPQSVKFEKLTGQPDADVRFKLSESGIERTIAISAPNSIVVSRL